MDHAWAFLAVCALTNTAFVHQKASKNQGKTLQNALVSKTTLEKAREVKSRLCFQTSFLPLGIEKWGNYREFWCDPCTWHTKERH